MSQASAARARAIENIGQSIGGAITSGFKQYQQNQFLTKQAMGKFGGQLQDPNFKKYVSDVLSGDPNAPTVPEPLKKALQNAEKGQVDVYDAALLGNMVDAYQDNLKGQLLRAQIAQAEAAARPQGQIMDMATYRATIAAYPEVDFQAKMLPDGRVAVQSGGWRRCWWSGWCGSGSCGCPCACGSCSGCSPDAQSVSAGCGGSRWPDGAWSLHAVAYSGWPDGVAWPVCRSSAGCCCGSNARPGSGLGCGTCAGPRWRDADGGHPWQQARH